LIAVGADGAMGAAATGRERQGIEMSDVQDTGRVPVDTTPGAAGTVPGGEATADPDEQVMDLLAEHVPLALLVDLITPEGPASADILRTEGMPDDAWWEAEENEAVAARTDGAPGTGTGGDRAEPAP
jgi:hypothetical protein